MQVRDTNHNSRGAPSSVSVSSASRFGYSSGYPSGNISDKPNNDPSLVPIIKPPNVSSETLTKYPSHVPKVFPGAKLRNILIGYPSRYPTGVPRTMPTDKPRPNNISHVSSDPDIIKRGIQESQVILQRNIILFILQITTYSYSSQISTRKYLQRSLIKSHLRVQKVYMRLVIYSRAPDRESTIKRIASDCR